MSRIAKNPIKISKDIECSFNQGVFYAKGKLGEMKILVNSNYDINIKDDEIKKETKDVIKKINTEFIDTLNINKSRNIKQNYQEEE